MATFPYPNSLKSLSIIELDWYDQVLNPKDGKFVSANNH